MVREGRRTMVCQVEERSWAPQVELGCLWRVAMVCLMEECEVVRLEEMVLEDWGM